MADSKPYEREHSAPDDHVTKDESHKKKTPILKTAWTKIGLTPGMAVLMLKGAIPPTISLAIYQATPVANTFSTLGYLVAVMSILSFAILPRAKFLQTMSLNILGILLGSCIALLAIYSSVQARKHTTPVITSTSNGSPSPGASVTGYSSSASAVSAIWLFANIWFVNTLRASRPQLQFPVIMYSIFANVASTYAPSFPTMASGISFVERLLEGFMTGFAIAAGVSLFVFPMTSRTVYFKQSAGLVAAMRGVLGAQVSFLQSLEKKDALRPSTNPEGGEKSGKTTTHHDHSARHQLNPESSKLKATAAALVELHGKIHGDIAFAKRETAFGKLDANDINEMFRLLQNICLPLSGNASVVDIFERIAENREDLRMLDGALATEVSESETAKESEQLQWNDIIKTLHEPFETITTAIDEGLQYCLYTLELAKPKKPKKDGKRKETGETSEDVEANAGNSKMTDKTSATKLANKIEGFHKQRKSTIELWCKERGIELGEHSNENALDASTLASVNVIQTQERQGIHHRQKRRLYLVLYMEFLLLSTAQAVLDLVKFGDTRVEQGVMKNRRIIVPGAGRLRKWAVSMWKTEDSGTEHTPDSNESGSSGVYSGASFQVAKDPEHLPPATAWQRSTNILRNVSRFMGSQESAFGFRVACATLSIGIIAYLKDTQTFFMQQRLVWAMIMVAIGMTATAGSGIFGFVGRIAGTAIAVVTSFIIWYIVNGNAAGVIVFIFVFTFIEFYFLIKFPRLTVIALISMVTQVLVVGYELQVQMIGRVAATSSGQPYYPTYLLAPYRLACVAGGLAVAFIWTFFPYPLTARSQLRKDLGASLYLLANFYSVVHTTVGMRVRGLEGDMESKLSPGRKLQKARQKVYGKELALLAGLRQHAQFTAWEPTVGGKFPRETYDSIISEIQNILDYLALISYASATFSHDATEDAHNASWARGFARLVGKLNTTSQEITSTLALLSASVTNGNPLPPYLKPPEAFKLTARLEELDADILSIGHILEPGYSAFAVMQIASSLITDDLGKLIGNVKKLVGEVDFSFHVHSTSDPSEETLWAKDPEKGKKD